MYLTSTLFLAFLSFLVWPQPGNGQHRIIPLPAYEFVSEYKRMPRSNALNRQTVLLKSGNSLKIPLCIRQDANYTIAGVRYSNDGGEDDIRFSFYSDRHSSIDTDRLGSFRSKAAGNFGTLWNVFHKSKQIGKTMNLKNGSYTLGLHVDSADYYGIEIDAILVETTDLNLCKSILTCQLHCLASHQSPVNINSTLKQIQVLQHSFPTECAEQDNIDVAIFHENIKTYQIIATYPKYNFSLNTRYAIFDNCETLSPQLLWRLKAKPSDVRQRVKTNLDSFNLDLTNGKPLVANITFRLKGKDDGLIDSDIGSVLKVRFLNVDKGFNIKCKYITREGRFSLSTQSRITKQQQNFTCTMPDYSWTEHQVNKIQLILTSSFNQAVKIDTMELSRRQERGQKKTLIFEGNDTIIEGRNVDFWWRRPRTMIVKFGDQTFQAIDFVTLYKRLTPTSRYNQVLIIYQDGNFRLLPLPPRNIDWTPFGSSIIIGQSELPKIRPVAEISIIEIVSVETNVVQIRLHYLDGGSAFLTINTGYLKMVLQVSQLNYKRPLNKNPFARFRSMWVTDGNCDVDHIRVNGGQIIPILNPWKKLNGTVVEFFRLCESMHLNLSPDITLQVLN